MTGGRDEQARRTKDAVGCILYSAVAGGILRPKLSFVLEKVLGRKERPHNPPPWQPRKPGALIHPGAAGRQGKGEKWGGGHKNSMAST